MTVAAILVASASVQIDDTPIALMPWDRDVTLIEYEIAQLLAGGASAIEVVLGGDADAIIPIIARDNVEPIVYAGGSHDLAGALRTGAAATPRGVPAAVVTDVARPRPAGVYERLLDAHFASIAPITRPSCSARHGWPLVVDEHVLAELRNVTDATGGIDAVLERYAAEIQHVEFEDAVVLLTIDSRTAYERARAQS